MNTENCFHHQMHFLHFSHKRKKTTRKDKIHLPNLHLYKINIFIYCHLFVLLYQLLWNCTNVSIFLFRVGVVKQCIKTFPHLQTHKTNSFVAINVLGMYLHVLTWKFFLPFMSSSFGIRISFVMFCHICLCLCVL